MASDLITVIKQKQAAIAQLQAELAEARALLTGETRPKPPTTRQMAGSLVSEVIPQRRRRAPYRRTRPGRAKLRGIKAAKGEIVPTSSVGRTIDVLKRAGKPLPIGEIVREIEAGGHTINKTTLFGNLSRYIKGKRVFYRAAPGVYGLLELRKGA